MWFTTNTIALRTAWKFLVWTSFISSYQRQKKMEILMKTIPGWLDGMEVWVERVSEEIIVLELI